MSSLEEPKVSPLNIRVKPLQKNLIEQAALVLDKSVSDFVREVAMREASQVLLDRKNFLLETKNWEEFMNALDAPPAENPRLKDLISRKPLWKTKQTQK